MITDVYLVDCENVGNKSLELSPSCKVLYFISYGQIASPRENDVVIPVSHDGSKNALDFILDSWLGYLICQYADTVKYHIVSEDKGFETIVGYWKSLGVPICSEKRPNEYKNPESKASYKPHSTAKLLSSLPPDRKCKVKNIYTNWMRSKHKKKSSMVNNISGCLKGYVSRRQTMQICDYLMKVGLSG